jgi:SSS family solute:Na+ symporter
MGLPPVDVRIASDYKSLALVFAFGFWRFCFAGPTLSHFTLIDAALVALSLAMTLWAGLYVKRYVGGLEDYLVAGRGMGLYIGTASLVSTEIGIITYAYQAQFGFLAGFSAFVVGLITIVVAFAVGQTGFVIARLREARVMTVPEYFERRYGRGVRVLAGVLMAVGGSLNLGIFPLIEARFLTILTGIDPRYVTWTMAALLLLALVYTAVGGMVSLLLTNYLQYVILAAGTIVVTLVCLRTTGWSAMSEAVTTRLHGAGMNPFADEGLGPAFVVWQVLLWIALMTVWQSVAMRAFSAADTRTSKRVYQLTSFLFLGRAVIPMGWGIAALAFFWSASAPLPRDPAGPRAERERLASELRADFTAELDRGRIASVLPRVDRLEQLALVEGAAADADRRQARAWREDIGLVAMPWMLASTLPTGLLGLVLAGMLAASVSTYAGYFLGWSAILAQDVVGPLVPGGLSDAARLRLTRLTVIALALFILVWSLVYKVPGPAYFYLQVTANLFMAPTLLTVVAGLYWRRASAAGATLAFLLGAGASLAYLVPGLDVGVAAAGNLSWGLALAGLVLGSLLLPGRARPAAAAVDGGPA